MFRKRILRPGAGIGYHEQTEDEIYYFLSGRGVMTLDGKNVDVGPGTAVLTRTGSSHGLKSVGSEDLVIIINYPTNGASPPWEATSEIARLLVSQFLRFVRMGSRTGIATTVVPTTSDLQDPHENRPALRACRQFPGRRVHGLAERAEHHSPDSDLDAFLHHHHGERRLHNSLGQRCRRLDGSTRRSGIPPGCRAPRRASASMPRAHIS